MRTLMVITIEGINTYEYTQFYARKFTVQDDYEDEEGNYHIAFHNSYLEIVDINKVWHYHCVAVNLKGTRERDVYYPVESCMITGLQLYKRRKHAKKKTLSK